MPALAPNRWSFSLGSLLLIVTVTAIDLAIYSWSPDSACIVLLISAPATFCVLKFARERRIQGRPLELQQKVLLYGMAILVMPIVALTISGAIGILLWFLHDAFNW